MLGAKRESKHKTIIIKRVSKKAKVDSKSAKSSSHSSDHPKLKKRTLAEAKAGGLKLKKLGRDGEKQNKK